MRESRARRIGYVRIQRSGPKYQHTARPIHLSEVVTSGVSPVLHKAKGRTSLLPTGVGHREGDFMKYILLITAAVLAATPAFAREVPYRDHNARSTCTTTWIRLPENQNARAILLASGPAHSRERYRFIASKRGQTMLQASGRWCAARGL